MPYRDPEKRREAQRRYYAGKGRVRHAERYRESRQREMPINPTPLLQVVNNWNKSCNATST